MKEFFEERSGKIIGLYRGHVFDIDEDEKDGSVLYHVMYEDNDSEDMSEAECRSCIDLYLYLQLEDGEINEWETGGDE